MDSTDQAYYKLRKNLDSHPIGFPATKSGVEIEILKHIFSPQEAEIASRLSYKFTSIDNIFRKTETLTGSKQELDEILQGILKKGGIETKTKDGIRYYRCIPLVVGMYECQQNELTPKFLKDFDEYTSDRAFGLEFIGTKLPQMRTIPVSKSLHPTHNVSTFDEISSLLQNSEGPFAIFECICRKKKTLEGKPCKVTDRKETCLGVGEMPQVFVEMNRARAISKDEAISIVAENQKEGLVLQPSNSREIEFICSCCGCCCGMLGMHKSLPKPLNYWVANYYALVDDKTCTGCGTCEDKCQVDAIKVSEQSGYAAVNPDRCIGCGNCVSNCPANSVVLEKKSKETTPPQNREELLDIIMKHKKGKFGKMMIKGRLIFDAVRTGQSHLLK